MRRTCCERENGSAQRASAQKNPRRARAVARLYFMMSSS